VDQGCIKGDLHGRYPAEAAESWNGLCSWRGCACRRFYESDQNTLGEYNDQQFGRSTDWQYSPFGFVSDSHPSARPLISHSRNHSGMGLSVVRSIRVERKEIACDTIQVDLKAMHMYMWGEVLVGN
jgi:hypothetical protein